MNPGATNGEGREAERAPEASVRISPAMRALYAGMKSGRTAAAAVQTAEERAPQPPAQPTAQTIRLRRDGARPLRFDGAQVLRRDAPAGGGGMRFSLALYVARTGELVASAIARPDDDALAGEVHAAAMLEDAAAFDRLLEGFAPENAVPEPSAAPAGDAERFADARWAIRQDYDAFSASVRRIAPPVDRRTRT